MEYAFLYLNHLFPLLSRSSVLATDADVAGRFRENGEKASGFPWSMWGAVTKQQALDRFGLQQIADYYRDNTTIISSTLKDELRKVGKDARLFRPQDVSSYVEGIRLFHNQNAYLARTHRSPVFIKFVTPGRDLIYLFSQLMSHSKNLYAADGSQWDANFPLFCVELIASFRSQGFSPEDKLRVLRYYEQMYCGFTNVQGNLLRLYGNPSGHHNTSTDNALLHCILMSIHAFRNGLTFDEMDTELFFRACGDDLIYSSLTRIYQPSELSHTYASCGVYLEFESLEPSEITELSFCGVRAMFREVNGFPALMYVLISGRSDATLHLDKKKIEPIDILMKIASICQLLFADKVRFDIAVEVFHQRLTKLVGQHVLSLLDARVVGLLRSIEPNMLMKRYLCWE